LAESRSDRLMVESTIALAHSLGRRVVAEGVQQREVLEMLTAMNCDVAQGFIIGRPMSLETLLKRIAGNRRVAVA
jgi:EAL domain-containing protein (putative c-di-GMP-specific phosphodiesterase class I)